MSAVHVCVHTHKSDFIQKRPTSGTRPRKDTGETLLILVVEKDFELTRVESRPPGWYQTALPLTESEECTGFVGLYRAVEPTESSTELVSSE